MNAIGHTRVRFKRTSVGSNGILECKFLPKNAHRAHGRFSPIGWTENHKARGLLWCSAVKAHRQWTVEWSQQHRILVQTPVMYDSVPWLEDIVPSAFRRNLQCER
jgi:hypothetical protein